MQQLDRLSYARKLDVTPEDLDAAEKAVVDGSRPPIGEFVSEKKPEVLVEIDGDGNPVVVTTLGSGLRVRSIRPRVQSGE